MKGINHRNGLVTAMAVTSLVLALTAASCNKSAPSYASYSSTGKSIIGDEILKVFQEKSVPPTTKEALAEVQANAQKRGVQPFEIEFKDKKKFGGSSATYSYIIQDSATKKRFVVTSQL